VSLVSILDADKEGFLRSSRSLIQTIGRAARNVSGEVHMYADKMTDSMREAIDETDRRRAKQSRTTRPTVSTRSRSARRSPTSSTRSIGRLLILKPPSPYRSGGRGATRLAAGARRASLAARSVRGVRGSRHRQHAARGTGRPDQRPDRAD